MEKSVFPDHYWGRCFTTPPDSKAIFKAQFSCPFFCVYSNPLFAIPCKLNMLHRKQTSALLNFARHKAELTRFGLELDWIFIGFPCSYDFEYNVMSQPFAFVLLKVQMKRNKRTSENRPFQHTINRLN